MQLKYASLLAVFSASALATENGQVVEVSPTATATASVVASNTWANNGASTQTSVVAVAANNAAWDQVPTYTASEPQPTVTSSAAAAAWGSGADSWNKNSKQGDKGSSVADTTTWGSSWGSNDAGKDKHGDKSTVIVSTETSTAGDKHDDKTWGPKPTETSTAGDKHDDKTWGPKPSETSSGKDKHTDKTWAATTTTESLTTFVTTTLCPITTTKSHGGSVEIVTTYSTSIVTVTSCAGGCHGGGKPTPTADKPEWSHKPQHPTTTIYPTTVVTVITSAVPCSTIISTKSGKPVWSTWASWAYTTTSYTSLCTTDVTVLPGPSEAVPTVVAPSPGKPQPTVTSVAPGPEKPVYIYTSACPAVATETVYVTVSKAWGSSAEASGKAGGSW